MGGGITTETTKPENTTEEKAEEPNDSGNEFYYIEGAKLEYKIESGTGARFRLNADYSLFEESGKVYVDGRLVDKKHYVSRSGSTIIELSPSYLNSLGLGEHVLSVVLAGDKKVDTTFVIRNEETIKETTEDKKEVPAVNAEAVTQKENTLEKIENPEKSPESEILEGQIETTEVETEVLESSESSMEISKAETESNHNSTALNFPKNEITEIFSSNENSPILPVIIIGVGLALLVLLFVVFKVVKGKNKGTTTTFFIIIAALLSVSLGVNAKAVTATGEVNGDQILDYSDIDLIKKHIVNLGQIAEENLENADMNGDGEITVSDLSLVIKKVEESVVYTVDINDVSLNNNASYVEKNTELTFKIDATTVNGSEIVGFTIDQTEYETRLENGKYNVVMPAQQSSGIKTVNFESARLDNGKVVNLSDSKSFEVLKDLPAIRDYLQTDKDNKVEITFNLDDPDDSLLSGTLKIKDKSGNEVDSHNIIKGSNTLEFNPGLSDSYRVDILINASRYSDKSNPREIKDTKVLNYKADYKTSVSQLKFYKKANLTEEVSNATLDDELVLGFTFGNAFNIEIDRLTINGKSYVLDGEKSAYGDVTVELDSSALRIGENTLNITEIVLRNGAVLDVTERATINIAKREPKVTNLYAVEGQNKLRIEAFVTDIDNASAKNIIKVLDDSNSVLSEKEIKSNKEEILEINVEDIITSRYTVELYAVIGGESQMINSVEAIANPRMKVLSATPSKELLAQNETIDITYKIFTSAENLEAFVIDNIEIPVTIDSTESGESVTVSVSAPKTAGQHDFTLQAVVDGGNFITVDHKTTVYIKKSAPSISVGEIIENESNSNVTFKLDISDEDNAFVSGKIKFYKESDPTTPVITKDISSTATDLVTVELEENVKYIYETESYYVSDPRVANPTSDTVPKEIEKVSGEYTLVRDNKLIISKIELRDGQNNVITSINKNSSIRIYMEFDTNLDTDGAQAVINDEKYDLIKQDDGYYVELPAGAPGNKSYRVTNIILSTLKNITLNEPKEISIDTKKDIPVVDGFFVGNKKSDLLVEFNLTDPDNAVTSGSIKIVDKGDGSVVKEEAVSSLQKGTNSLKYPLTANKNYTVTLTVNYSNTIAANEKVVKETDYRLEVKDSVVEFKDVYNVTLYKSTEKGLVEDESIDKNNLPTETSNLYLKIDMKNLPTYYAGIESLEAREDKIYAVLDETEFLQYTKEGDRYVKQENVEFEISYEHEGVIQGGTGNARSFFETIAANPAGTFNLTRDLDATDIKTVSPIVNDVFSGTLNGNGFTIYNLNTTLFKELNGATIKNINFVNVNIKGNTNNKGLIASKANNSSTISDINVKNLVFTSGATESGSLVGALLNKSKVINVYVENALVTGSHTRTGGMVGAMSGNSEIDKSLFEGYVKANSTAGEVGGIVGWGQNSKVGSVIYKGKITSENSNRVGAIMGYGNNSTKLAGTLTVAEGENAYAVYGEGANIAGDYSIVEPDSTLELHDVTGAVETIMELDSEFMGLDDVIRWFIAIDEENIQRVANIIQREFKEPQISTEVSNSTSVKYLTGYDKTKANLYNNLSKIMPFADAQIWIDSAKKITNDNLKNNEVKYVIPFAGDAQVAGVNRANADSITKIKIVYENDIIEEYEVTLKNIADLVIAEYNINSLGIKYQYPAYLNTVDSELVNALVSAAEGYDYSDIRFAENENRLYQDNYNDVVKPLLTEFITKYISSQTKYPTYLSNVNTNAAIKEELITSGRLKYILRAYNYYKRWYDIDMGSSNVSDTVFINSYINYGVSIEDMVDKVLAGTTGSAETQNFYGNRISQYTGKTLIEYLGLLTGIYTEYQDPNEWFKSWFKGVLIETPADSAINTLKYRIWENLAKTRQNLILPLLSAPNTEETYLVSIPTTIILGSLNKYMADPYDEISRNNFTNSATEYSRNFARVYGTSSNILPDGERLVNEGYTQMHFETRLGFHSGSKYPGTQSIYTTEDPTLKWIFCPIGIEVAQNGAQAYGQGGDVLWEITSAIGQVYVASHESSHTQYRSYWYNGNGGRPGTGFEANADGALSQQVGDGGLVFNLYGNYNRDNSDISNNYSYERIDTPEEAFDFYKNLFDSSYVMDYLAAKAFLKLDASVQARVAVKAQENKKGNAGGTMSTTYARLTEEEIRDMNLSSIDDLIDNKIMVRNTGTVSEANDGTYGTESLWVFNWYQPHNDTGSPDDNTFKKLGWEMFGYKGIEGFYTYRSNLSRTDLDAIQKISGDENMTWDAYKKMRFAEVENHIGEFKYIDTEDAIDQFVKAFNEDAITGEYNKSQNLKRIYHQIVKKKSNDYTDGSTYEFSPVVINSAKDLVDAINTDPYGVYELGENIDFTDIAVDSGKDYYMEKFVGTIDGKGYTISGVKYPLFNSTNFTSINNVVIDGSGYTGDTKAIIVINSKNTVLYNVIAQGIEFSVPYVRSTNGSYYEYDCEVRTVNDIVINTPEDLINISNTGLNKTYRLGNNIDMSGQNVSGVVVPGTFTGTLDGKGFSITGLKNTLFQKTEKANIKNLVISDANVTGKSIVANEVTMETVISRVLIADSVFTANQNESGTFAGKLDGKSTIEMCAITGITISGPYTRIGGFVGAVNLNGNSTVTDCYIEGTIENTNGITGGIIGFGNGDSWIKDSIVNITLNNTTDSSGGVLGKINYARTGENCWVKNVLSLADGTSGNRIMRVDTTAGLSQYYNLRGSSGNNYAISTSKLAPYTIAVAEITPEGITEDFFKNTLRLRSDRWELSGAAADSLPVLKFLSYEASPLSLDEDLEEEEVDEEDLEDETFDEENNDKEDTAVEDLDNEDTDNEQSEDKTEDAAEEEKSAVIEIASLDDFLKIKDNLAGEYLLTKSISFEGVDIEEAAFIMGTFTGKLRGLDGCTITGLLKPLFEKIGDGAIIEVIIEMADISK